MLILNSRGHRCVNIKFHHCDFTAPLVLACMGRNFTMGIWLPLMKRVVACWSYFDSSKVVVKLRCQGSNLVEIMFVRILDNGITDLRLLECNGFTYLKPSRGFKNLLLFKYMPFEDDPPHHFSHFLIFWLYKQDWKFALYSYLGEVIWCNITSL